ncbi:MAG: response regulator SirA [Planctomycetes bacterium RBG_16_43_13]|nr:MAG: response regulator SirA [Planctomycetes bacterium RBG_16_43_13]
MKHFLDITKEHCPMTFVKVKLELSKMSPGDQLEVLLNEGEPLDNVPKSAVEQGFKVTSIRLGEKPHHLVIIER